MMDIEAVVVYHITDKEDLPVIEKAIREEDKEAFQEQGAYFRDHRGMHFLLNEADIGCQSDVRSMLLEKYDPQGGLMVTGTTDEMRALECLLDSDDCSCCFLGNRLLVLLKQETYLACLVWMKQQCSPDGAVGSCERSATTPTSCLIKDRHLSVS